MQFNQINLQNHREQKKNQSVGSSPWSVVTFWMAKWNRFQAGQTRESRSVCRVNFSEKQQQVLSSGLQSVSLLRSNKQTFTTTKRTKPRTAVVDNGPRGPRRGVSARNGHDRQRRREDVLSSMNQPRTGWTTTWCATIGGAKTKKKKERKHNDLFLCLWLHPFSDFF